MLERVQGMHGLSRNSQRSGVGGTRLLGPMAEVKGCRECVQICVRDLVGLDRRPVN
jgi:hypothetical protein